MPQRAVAKVGARMQQRVEVAKGDDAAKGGGKSGGKDATKGGGGKGDDAAKGLAKVVARMQQRVGVAKAMMQQSAVAKAVARMQQICPTPCPQRMQSRCGLAARSGQNVPPRPTICPNPGVGCQPPSTAITVRAGSPQWPERATMPNNPVPPTNAIKVRTGSPQWPERATTPNNLSKPRRGMPAPIDRHHGAGWQPAVARTCHHAQQSVQTPVWDASPHRPQSRCGVAARSGQNVPPCPTICPEGVCRIC